MIKLVIALRNVRYPHKENYTHFKEKKKYYKDIQKNIIKEELKGCLLNV